MLEFYHISDLHFGQGLFNSRDGLIKDFLERLYAQEKFEGSQSKFLLITGDITQAGKKKEYERAIKELERFKGKIFFVPGNHDYGNFFSIFYDPKSASLFDSLLCQQLQPGRQFLNKDLQLFPVTTNDEKVLLIGLNSCLVRSATGTGAQKFGQAFGLVGYKQLAALKELFEKPEYAEYKIILLLHHIPDQYAQGITMDLLDREDLIAIAIQNVDAFCYGHEGGMKEPEEGVKAVRAPIPKKPARPMKLRRMAVPQGLVMTLAKGLKASTGTPYSLDANHSIDDSSCYLIKVTGGTLDCDLVPVAKGKSRPLPAARRLKKKRKTTPKLTVKTSRHRGRTSIRTRRG
jgi:predicted phosphohydrolase